jgi:hypothetical protein
MRLNFNRSLFRYGGEPGTVADHLINVALLQLMRDRRCRVAGIDARGPDWKPDPIPLPGQAAQIRHRVVHVGRRYTRVGDDGVSSIHGALIEVEDPLRLAILHHVAGVRIGAANFDLLRLHSAGFAFNGTLPCAARSSLAAPSSVARYS